MTGSTLYAIVLTQPDFEERTSTMPKLTVKNVGEFEVPEGKRLVLALRDEVGIDQLHACGGKGKCTTCAVTILDGQAGEMRQGEKETLERKGISGVRLSCQMQCTGDLEIEAPNLLSTTERDSCGPRPTDEMEP